MCPVCGAQKILNGILRFVSRWYLEMRMASVDTGQKYSPDHRAPGRSESEVVFGYPILSCGAYILCRVYGSLCRG